MAINDTIYTTSWISSTSGNYWKVKFQWKATQDLVANQSAIDWTLSVETSSTSYITVNELRLTLGAEVVYYKNTSNRIDGYDGVVLGRGRWVINHKPDGSIDPISVKVEAGLYDWAINRTGEGTIQLTQIPRATSITSITGTTETNKVIINFSKLNSAYYEKYSIELIQEDGSALLLRGDSNVLSTNGSNFPVEFSDNERKEIYNKIINSTRFSLRFTLITYTNQNYTNEIGRSTRNIVLQMDDSIRPQFKQDFTSIDIDSLEDEQGDFLIRGILAQNLNQVRMQAYSLPAGEAFISSYKFEAFYNNNIIASKTTGRGMSSAYLGPFSQTGDIRFKITLIDSRGRTNTYESTISCVPYSPPTLENFRVYRCKSQTDINADKKGNYICCSFEPKYSNLGGKNNFTVKLQYKKRGETSWTEQLNYDGTTGISAPYGANDYQVRCVITDTPGKSYVTPTITIYGQNRVLHINSAGSGIAIGKPVSDDGGFDCAWDINCEKNINCEKDIKCKGNINCERDIICDGDISCDGNIYISYVNIFELIYPVGSIFLTTDSNHSPASLFGVGRWEYQADFGNIVAYAWKRVE